MKRNSLRYSLMAMVVLFAVACQPESVLPEPDLAQQSDNDRCKHVATVVEGDCGLYMVLENGTPIYARSTKDIELQAGMQLEIGYTFQQQSNSYNGHSGGQCGTSSSSQESQPDDLELCMGSLGVREVRLTCIRVTDSPSDETTG